MPEFLENPRRVPRDPVRCRAHVVGPTGPVDTTTENIGSRGCQLVLPAPVPRGSIIALTLAAPRSAASLRIEGRVAWVSPRPPWRVGVAFAPQSLGEAARWMEAIRKAAPELFGPGRRLEDRIAMDATVYLGLPPRLPDFTEDDVAVLRTVWTGVRIAELRARFAGSWSRVQRSFFALLAQGSLTLSRAASAHPVAWRAVFGEAAAAPRVLGPEDLAVDRTPAEPEPAPKPPPLPSARPTVPAAPVPPPLPAHAAPASAATRPAIDAARPRGTPVPDFVGAGVGWRGGAARPRSSEAETLFQAARGELERKNHHQALKLLRSALTLAPGDPEIADAIARAMGKGS